MRRAFCAAVCILVLALSPAMTLAADQRAVLTLRVNLVPKNEVTVTLHDDDVLVRRSDLEDAGLHGFSFNGKGKPSDLIPLSTLKPGLTFRLDDVTLVLDLTVLSNHLDANVVDYRPHQDLTLAKPVRSGFLNYAVSTSDQTGGTFSSEFGTHVGSGMFSSTMSVAANQTYRSNITRWIFDSPQKSSRLTLGDVVTSTGDLGGTVAIAGIGVERYFALNPNTVRTVLPDIAGNALTPSTADVYVNGVLYRHETLPPGQFTFQNLPVTEGPNTTSVVVTDAFGRRQTYSNYFYGADNLLARGLSDFSYGAGFLHSQFGQQIGSGPAAAGRYVKGLTDNLTAGGRLEVSRSVISGGPIASFRARNGIISAAAALGRDGAGTGGAALFSYQHVGPQITSGFSLIVQSPRYASLSLKSSQDRATLNGTFSIAKQFDRSHGVSLAYSRLRDRDNGEQSGWQISQTALLSDTTQLQVSETLTTGPNGKRIGVQTALNFIARKGLNASLTATNSGGRTQTSLQLNHAISSETPSFGYLVSATAGSGATSEYASATYRNQVGDYSANVGLGSGQNAFSLSAAGGVVLIGGHIMPTQPVDDSYALVDADGLANVRILANNVVVGRTNKSGLLVVPHLGSYYNNDITIDSADTPLNYSIEDQTRRLAPMYRSGGVVHFGINRVRPVTGTLLIRSGASNVIPAFGLLELSSGDTKVNSDIGEDGAIYFDKLEPGTYAALIRYKDGECSFNLNVPASQATFIKLGTVVCESGARR